MSSEKSLVALLPQEEYVEDGVQLSPPGFNAIVLPYADEVRESKTTEESLCDVKPSQGVCDVQLHSKYRCFESHSPTFGLFLAYVCFSAATAGCFQLIIHTGWYM